MVVNLKKLIELGSTNLPVFLSVLLSIFNEVVNPYSLNFLIEAPTVYVSGMWFCVAPRTVFIMYLVDILALCDQ